MNQAQVDVLIVDDDESIRTMLRRTLQRAGLVVTEARDGVEALQCLQTINCAVILLDLMVRPDSVHAVVRKPFDMNELAEIIALCVATWWAGSLSRESRFRR